MPTTADAIGEQPFAGACDSVAQIVVRETFPPRSVDDCGSGTEGRHVLPQGRERAHRNGHFRQLVRGPPSLESGDLVGGGYPREGGIRIGAEVGVDAGQGRHQVDDHLPVEEIGRELNFEVNPAGIAGGVALLDEVDEISNLALVLPTTGPTSNGASPGRAGWVTCDV